MTGSRITIVLFALLTVTAPGEADWLYLRSGGRIETQGAWTVRGRQVVFTSKAGALQSVAIEEIDLDATRTAKDERPVATQHEDLLAGRPVVLPSTVPTELRRDQHERLAAFIRNPDAPRVKGTLSRSKSFLAELYELYPQLAVARQQASERIGDKAMREVEADVERNRKNLFRLCQQAGADAAPELQDPCHAEVLHYLLKQLASQ